MGEEQANVRQQVEALLAIGDQVALLRELDRLAEQDREGFGECADLWAPALYDRNTLFFEPWLIRRLDAAQAQVIQGLLTRAEADRYDALFVGLYRKIIDEAAWNGELRELAHDPRPDDVVARAILLRAAPEKHLALDEMIALALYARDPERLGAFIFDHCLPGQNVQMNRQRSYAELRLAARAHGDLAFVWALFRRFATPEEWTRELHLLMDQPVAPTTIVAELRLRQPENFAMLETTAPLIPIVTRYGAAALPYIGEVLNWLGATTAVVLLPEIERLGDDDLYRRVFFRYGDPEQWNTAIARLLAAQPNDEALARALQRWTPLSRRWSERYWWLSAANARALYARDPQRFHAFLERTLHALDAELFDVAEAQRDEVMLDLLTARFFEELNTAIAYRSRTQHEIAPARLSRQARQLLERFGQRVIARFERLAETAPSLYVAHAAPILRNGLGLTRFLSQEIAPNPARWLLTQHLEAWLHHPGALRDLLDAQRAEAIEFGLALLEQGGPEAVARADENQALLRALVMRAPTRKTRRRALLCLERAALAEPTYATRLLPVLDDLMAYQAERSIDLRAMVSFVRARRAATSQTA